jgi:hypothetical protein
MPCPEGTGAPGPGLFPLRTTGAAGLVRWPRTSTGRATRGTRSVAPGPASSSSPVAVLRTPPSPCRTAHHDPLAHGERPWPTHQPSIVLVPVFRTVTVAAGPGHRRLRNRQTADLPEELVEIVSFPSTRRPRSDSRPARNQDPCSRRASTAADGPKSKSLSRSVRLRAPNMFGLACSNRRSSPTVCRFPRAASRAASST